MEQGSIQILRLHWKILHWLPAVLTFLFLAGYLMIVSISTPPSEDSGSIADPRRIVETVVPLVFCLHTAFSLAPEGEPALELLLTLPVRVSRLSWWRLGALSLLYGGVAAVATVIVGVMPSRENLAVAFLRWFAGGVVFGGVALLATQLTRQGVFGALLATFLWLGDIYGGEGLLKKWPNLWPIHIYLQPQEVTPSVYLLNRLCLIAIGFGLILITMLLLKNDERVLGIR
jgi:hypothetical protein